MSEEAAERARDQVAGQGGSMQGEEYVKAVDQAIDATTQLLEEVASHYRDNPLHSLKGFLAEAFHVGTFNVDAARRGLGGVKATLISDNGPVDAVVEVGSERINYQLKYYRNATETAKAVSDPSYDGMGKVGPSDQVEAAREAALHRAARVEGHRPEQAAHLRHTSQNLSDRMEGGGAQSRSLSHEESVGLAREGQRGEVDVREHGVTLNSVIEPLDAAREAAKAGASAMAVSAALSAAPHIIHALQETYRGDRELAVTALKEAVRQGGRGAGAGFIRGAIASGVQIACRSGALGEAARSATPGAVGATTAIVLRALVDAYKLSRGEITAAQFADRTAGGCAAGVAGMYGAAAGQALVPIPIVGALLGSFIGSTLGSLGYDGLKRGIQRIENREGWEAQVALAKQIAALGEALQVTANGAIVLVGAQDQLARSIAASARTWQAQSLRLRAELARIDAQHRQFDDRQQTIEARLAALRASAAARRRA